MENEVIAGIYRDIGKKFHSFGAHNVIIMSSQVLDAHLNKMTMEVAVSGITDISKLKQCASECWENIDMKIISLEENPFIADMAYEDGIIL